jgi:spoIIIJ-associated protein
VTDGIEHTPANDASNPTGRSLSDDGPAATAVDEPQNDDRRSADEDGTSESGVGESEQSSDNLLETEGEIAADYLEELLDVADLDGDIDTYVENDRAQVSLITESERLIGSEGEVLEALQELTRLAVTNQTGERSRLMLDIGGFRQDRRRKLTELATDVIDEVKTSGESVRLDPMNPFERKIVHDAVAAAGLTSESDGVEPERRVVVRPSE